MLGADLNASPKILVRAAVIDRNHVATLQVRCDFVHPIERGLIENRLIDLAARRIQTCRRRDLPIFPFHH